MYNLFIRLKRSWESLFIDFAEEENLTLSDVTQRTQKAFDIEKDHPSLDYYIKKRVITDNLYGVDIMEEAVEIAKLR
jgi:hypothetical protein